MTVLFHMTEAPPRIPGTDAVYQDVAALQQRFGGGRVNLYPFRRHGPLLRLERLAGAHLLPRLLKWDRRVQVHHVFGGSLRYYPVLRALERPVVYSVMAGMQGNRPPPAAVRRVVQSIVVASTRNLETLEGWGYDNVTVIRPGIDVHRFHHHPKPLDSRLVLLAGSAPWVKGQFVTKGFDALFAVVARRPDIRLVLLWRGLLEVELGARLRRYNLEDRVSVVRGRADVNALLGRAHAALVLAEHPHLIKEFPHSLIESLVAGKPVLLSECIAMADYVRDTGCGTVVPALTEEVLETAVDRLISDYEGYQRQALQVGRRDFSVEGMLDQYRRVYEACGYVARAA